MSLAIGGLAQGAQAGATIDLGKNKSVSLGAGIRTSFLMTEDGAPSGEAYSKDFTLNNMRLYVSGQATEDFSFEFNTEVDRTNGSAARVLDALVKYEPTEAFKLRAGRMLPPSDRSNLDGPYYLNTFAFPLVAQRYPALYAGRDDGAALWGTTGDGAFKYQVGAFEGRQGTSDVDDNLLYAGRLTVNLLDPEPGYYNASTYYGAKDILALGLVGMYEKDGAGTAANPGDFTGWNVDGLYETTLGTGGVITLEGAYYSYDRDDVAVAGQSEGRSILALASYMLGTATGPGKLQPHIRYQSFSPEDDSGDHTRLEGGINYIVDGHDAKFSLIGGNEEDEAAGTDSNFFLLGLQLQV
jgi:hypothetical protein